MRRFVIRTLGALLVAQCLCAGVAWAASAPSRPNLVFVTSDDHRWDALGVAGNGAVHTPVLDRLAREGVYFAQATVNVSQCLPVRGTFLTGRTAHTHGAYAHHNQRPEAALPTSFADWPTVPKQLREAGYETVLVGKWHLASDPWKVGFSRTLTWLPTGAQLFKDPDLCQGESRECKSVKGFTQSLFADSAIGYLESRDEEAPPFLLWLAFTAPHAPFAPNPPEAEALYRGKTTLELLPPGFPRDIPTNNWQHYYEGVSALDTEVGRVLDALERKGLRESTVVVFLGDNGFMMGDRGVGTQGGKGKVVPYEGSIRVPMMIRAPGFQRYSGATAAAVSSLDIPATLLTLAGLTPPSQWPGRDLIPALRSAAAPGFDDAFSEWADNRSAPFGHLAHRLVRTPAHKLILWEDPAKPLELYDLEADPRESRNLAGSPEVQAVQKDLTRRLLAWLEKTEDPARAWPQVPPLGGAVGGGVEGGHR